MAVAAIPFGLAIGLSLGLLGGGGSVLALPVLVYVLGQTVHEATTASLVVVAAGAVAGGLGHHRGGRVCWRHAAIFSAAAIPGIVGGTAAGDAVGDSALIVAFAAIMALAAIGMWRRASSARTHPDTGSEPIALSKSQGAGGLCPPLKAGRDIGAGAVIGFMTGFFGVGGGFLIVPTLAIALAFSLRLAIATSLAIITITSVFGVLVHLGAGRDMDVPLTIAMAAACAAGAYGGGRLAAKIPTHTLTRGFAVLVAAVAGYLLVSSVFFGGPPGA
jgi:uncharacterized membrane protein YfcA